MTDLLLVEQVARALYQCEKERSDHCDAVISAAKGKTVSIGMEPWEECWQLFHADARAAIAAMEAHRQPVTVASQWQPIETAPNNVMLVTNGGYVLAACQNDGHWFVGWQADPVHIRIDLEGEDAPTHWMHLPPPPSIANKVDGKAGESG